jgi:hypothetical protein
MNESPLTQTGQAKARTRSTLDQIDRRLQLFEEESRAAWGRLELKLDLIAGGTSIGEVGEVGITPERWGAADRKRLKERLKEAAAVRSSDSLHGTFGNPSLMERVFGICEGDARAGKERSRYCDSSYSPPPCSSTRKFY